MIEKILERNADNAASSSEAFKNNQDYILRQISDPTTNGPIMINNDSFLSSEIIDSQSKPSPIEESKGGLNSSNSSI